MRDTIDMAREAGFELDCTSLDWHKRIKAFEALVRADEREGAYKRRGTLMFNPYTGTPRHPSDVASDPHGILMLDPEQPIRARGNT
jgi:hypothetical protein